MKKIALSQTIRAYSVTGIGVALSQLIALLSIPYIAKLSGAEVFGLYSYFVSIAMIFTVICSLKIENAVFVVSEESLFALKRFFQRVVWLTLLLLTLLFTSYFLLSPAYSWWMLIVLLLSIFSICQFEFLIQWNVRKGNFLTNSRLRLTRAVFFPFMVLLLSLFSELNAEMVLFSFALSHLCCCITVKKDKELIKTDLSSKEQFEIYRIVKWLTPAHFIRQYATSAVVLLSGFFLLNADKELGYLALALKLTIAPAAIIILAISDVFKKKLIESPETALRHYVKVFLFSFLAAMAWILILLFAAEPAILFFMDETWLPVVAYIHALFPFLIATMIFSPITYVYLVMKKSQIDFAWQCINACVISFAVWYGLQHSVLTSVCYYSWAAALMLFISAFVCVSILLRVGKE